MAFTPLNSVEIASGEPTKTEIFTKIKDCIEDLNNRLVGVEATQTNFIPITFSVHGRLDELPTPPNTDVLIQRITFDCTIVAVRLQTQQAGSSGTNEIDIQLIRGVNPPQSIFSTLPSVDFSAGDYAYSTNQVLATTALLAGDILRLDITGRQPEGVSIIVYVEIEI